MTNYEKIGKIVDNNKGYVTRKDTDSNKISSWFLTDYIRKNNLKKVDKGFYALEDWIEDHYLIFQYKYPGYIFSHQCALYLNQITDRIPYQIEVSCKDGYNPRSKKGNEIVHVVKDDYYNLGITELPTMFGNNVKVYDLEKTVCEVIKYRTMFDAENYVKAIRAFLRRKDKNFRKLMEYAKQLCIEEKVYDVFEVMMNEN